jgi:hypothetical protein
MASERGKKSAFGSAWLLEVFFEGMFHCRKVRGLILHTRQMVDTGY